MNWISPVKEILEALFTPVLAFAVAYTAIQQYRLSRESHILRLTERRFELFMGMMQFIGYCDGACEAQALDLGIISQMMSEYFAKVKMAAYLFDREVVAYLVQFGEKSLELQRLAISGSAKKELEPKAVECLGWFTNQKSVIEKKFGKYVNLWFK
jgi:hypothetical protein